MAKFNFLNFIEGAYTDVSPILIPENGLYIQDNCITSYKIGSILKRPGYINIDSALQADKSITGLHNFRQSASTQKMLATIDDSTSDDTQLFYSTGAAWTEVGAAETAWINKAGINVEMEDFLGYCFFVGYGSTDGFLPVGSLTGTTFSTSTNVTNMPTAKYIKRYRDRLYVANIYDGGALPYRVGYSDLPSGSTIAWTEYQADTALLDVDYSEAITGLSSNWDRLVIFTEYSAYMYNQSEKKKMWDIGCANHRTIKNSGAYMIWANMDGVWLSSGGFPENISGRVSDFIKATDMTGTFAEIVDEEYYLYLGAVSVNGVSYSNLTLVYNIPSKTWRWHEYADTMTAFGKFYSSGQDYLFMGDSSGDVHRMGKYTDTTLLKTDDGTPIHSWWQTGALSFGDPSVSKGLGKLIAYSDRAQGLLLKARVIDRNTMSLTPFKKLGQLTKYINEFQINPDKGHLLQIEGVENGSNEYWSLFGFTVDVDVDKPFKK